MPVRRYRHPGSVLYRKIADTDKERRLYGLIPLMASSSYGQLGALNAESFCERVLSCANNVLTDGNTLLGLASHAACSVRSYLLAVTAPVCKLAWFINWRCGGPTFVN